MLPTFDVDGCIVRAVDCSIRAVLMNRIREKPGDLRGAIWSRDGIVARLLQLLFDFF
jgi:hypothetical protein